MNLSMAIKQSHTDAYVSIITDGFPRGIRGEEEFTFETSHRMDGERKAVFQVRYNCSYECDNEPASIYFDDFRLYGQDFNTNP